MNNSIHKSSNSRQTSDADDTCVRFDGYPIWRTGPSRFIDTLLGRAADGKPTLASYLNAHVYNLACGNDDLRIALTESDWVYPDGYSVVIACALAGCGWAQRMTTADFFDDFARRCEQTRLKLYIVASKEAVLQRACETLTKRFPKLSIVGRHHGYLRLEDDSLQPLLGDIAQTAPNILIVGMGSPLQEVFARLCRRSTSVPIIWTVGALFDYYGGAEKLAPRWLSRWGFEWLYRLVQDPRGKWRRYTLGNVLFVARAGAAAVRQRFGIRK